MLTRAKRKEIEDEALELAKEEACEQQEALRQYNVVQREGREGCCAPKVMVAECELLKEALVWSGAPDLATAPPQQAHLLQPLYSQIYPSQARLPRQRVVADGVLTADELQYFRYDARDRFGDPLFGDEDDDAGSDSVSRVDWGEHPFNDLVISRVCGLIRRHFQEDRPLFLGGALLTRKRFHVKHTAPYVHVDKANIGSYDYSVVVYLSTVGVDFEGGQFAFRDPLKDEVIKPRKGRLVLFGAGPHNLHCVHPVTAGERTTLTAWFTLHGHGQEGCGWADYHSS